LYELSLCFYIQLCKGSFEDFQALVQAVLKSSSGFEGFRGNMAFFGLAACSFGSTSGIWRGARDGLAGRGTRTRQLSNILD
jgi:hypothetical protein